MRLRRPLGSGAARVAPWLPARIALVAPTALAALVAIAALVALAACDRSELRAIAPRAELSARTLDFGVLPVLHERELSLGVRSASRSPLRVLRVGVQPDDGAFWAVDPEAVAVIPGGDSASLRVAFVPPREERLERRLVLDTDDPELPVAEVTLVGEGRTSAALALEPAALDFGRVGECGAAVAGLAVRSTGTAALVVESLALDPPAPGGPFAFVGSARVPATVEAGADGRLELTLRAAPPPGSSGQLEGALLLRTTDPQHRDVRVPLRVEVDRAPVPSIAPLPNGAPGLVVALDGSGSIDPDGAGPLSLRWTLVRRPPGSLTRIEAPELPSTTMRLDPNALGLYEVQLEAADPEGRRSCAPASATVVAAPAEKLLVELFWDHPGTDLDLHVLRTPSAAVGDVPDDCHFQNREPDWGEPGPADDPRLLRDALTGYGPERFGYAEPIPGTFRLVVVFANELLSPSPSSTATVRVFEYGLLKAELVRALPAQGAVWDVATVEWPSGAVRATP